MPTLNQCDECDAPHGGHECWCSLHTPDTDIAKILADASREVAWWICVAGRRVQRFHMPPSETASPTWIDRQVSNAFARGEDWAGTVTTEKE